MYSISVCLLPATRRTSWRGHEKTRMKKGVNDSHHGDEDESGKSYSTPFSPFDNFDINGVDNWKWYGES